MPNIQKEPSEVKAFDIGQIWRTAWGNEATIYRTDTLGFMSAKLDNRELVIYDSNGKTACQNEKYELMRYLRDTNLVKIEVGKKYKTQSGKTIAIEKSDRWYFLTTEGEYYEQFSFGANDPVVALVEDEPAKVEQPAEKLKQRPELKVGQVWSLRDSQEGTIIFEPYKGVFEMLCHESNISTLVEKSSSELSVYLRETDRPKLEIGKLYKKKNGSIVTIEESKPNGEREIYWGSDAHWYTQFGFKAFHRNGSKEDLVEEVVSLKVGQIYQDRKGGEWVVMSRIDKNKSEDCFKFACRSLSQDISYYFSKNGRFVPSMNEHSLDLIKLIKNTEEGAAMPTEEIVKVEVIDEFAEVDSFFQSVKNNKLELKSLREENESLKSDLAKTVYDRNEMDEQLGLETSKNQDLLKKQQELNDYIANLEDQVHASRKDLDSEIELTSLFQAEIKTLEESKQVQETKYGKVCAENYELRQIIKRLEDHCDHLQKQVGICLKQEFILLGTKRTLENDILALTTENVRLAKKLKALETILEPDHK